MRSRVIISGKNSFIGQNIINSLKDFDFTEVDMLNVSIPKINFRDSQTVIHLAAIGHQKKSIPDSIYFKVNSDLGFYIAQKAKQDDLK